MLHLINSIFQLHQYHPQNTGNLHAVIPEAEHTPSVQ